MAQPATACRHAALPGSLRVVLRMVIGVSLSLAPMLCLTACNERIKLHPSVEQRFAPWTATSPAHRLGPGDQITLRFLFNTELNADATIGPDGRVTVPLLGDVSATGQTIADFTHTLETGYARSLRVPELDVIMRSYGSEHVYVGGEVKAPGLIALSDRVDVLQAVLLAGGLLPTARLGQVAVIRRDDAGQPMLRLVSLRALVGNPTLLLSRRAGATPAGPSGPGDDFPLAAGDIVYVVRSDVADLDLFVDQYFNQAIPFQKSLNFGQFNGPNL